MIERLKGNILTAAKREILSFGIVEFDATHQVKWNVSSHARRRNSHCETMFHMRSVFHKPRKGFIS